MIHPLSIQGPKQEYKQRYLGLHLLPSLPRSHPEGTGQVQANTPVHTSKLCPPLGHSLASEVHTRTPSALGGWPWGRLLSTFIFLPRVGNFFNFYLFFCLSDRYCICTVTFWINSCHFLSFPRGCPPCLNLSTLGTYGSQYLTCVLQMFFLSVCQ